MAHLKQFLLSNQEEAQVESVAVTPKPFDKNRLIDYDAPVYDDGLDETLLGDEADRLYFNSLSAVNQETEIYEREQWRNKHYSRWQRRQKALTKEASARSSRSKRNRDTALDNPYSLDLKRHQQSSQLEEDTTYADSEGYDPDEMQNVSLAEEDKNVTMINQLDYELALALQIRREDVVRWSGLSWLNEILLYSLVRFRAPITNNYVCGMVSKIHYGSSYLIEPKDDSSLSNIRLGVIAGHRSTNIRLSLISNQPFEPQEITEFLDRNNRHGTVLPSIAQFQAKVEQISKYRNYKLSSKDIAAKVTFRNKLKFNIDDPELLSATTKPKLLALLQIAQEENNQPRIDTIQQLLDEIEQQRQERLKATTINSKVNLLSLNQRLQQRQEEQEAIWNQSQNDILREEDSSAKKSQTKLDPFARRKTRPTNLWKAGNSTSDQNKTSEPESTLSSQPEISETDPSKMLVDDIATTLKEAHSFIIDISL